MEGPFISARQADRQVVVPKSSEGFNPSSTAYSNGGGFSSESKSIQAWFKTCSCSLNQMTVSMESFTNARCMTIHKKRRHRVNARCHRVNARHHMDTQMSNGECSLDRLKISGH